MAKKHKDEFTTSQFIISSKSQNNLKKLPARWVNENEKLIINGRKFNKGLFYIGESLDGLSSSPEPSLINEKLTTNHPLNLSKFKKKAIYYYSWEYFTSYADLSKTNRGIYLDWLSSRHKYIVPISFVFIYFCGLERRIIKNHKNSKVSDQEFIAIFNELLILNKCFGYDQKFHKATINLLQFMILCRFHLLRNKINSVMTKNDLSIKIKILDILLKNKCINSDWFIEFLFDYLWKKFILNFDKISQHQLKFATLFRIKFTQKFGKIIKINLQTVIQKISYDLILYTQSIDLTIKNLPDIKILEKHIEDSFSILQECYIDMSNYINYCHKYHNREKNINSMILLPKEIINDPKSPITKLFKKSALKIIQKKQGLINIQDFLLKINYISSDYLNNKNINLLIDFAYKNNIGIVPNQTFYQEKIKKNDNIVLFKLNDQDKNELSSCYYKFLIVIKLSLLLLVKNNESILYNLIKDNDQISSFEKKILTAYLLWNLNKKITTLGLKAQIEKLTPDDIQYIRQTIIDFALKNFNIENQVIKKIEKIYTLLKLDKEQASNDIYDLIGNKKFSSTKTTEMKNGDFFNQDILSKSTNETNEIKKILADIFVDEEPNTLITHCTGLDAKHKKLLNVLQYKEKYSYEEFNNICRKLDLMSNGAIETLNNWSFEQIDNSILDYDNNEIIVEIEIIEKLIGTIVNE